VGGIYTHDVVVHDRHFVDPNDAKVHTQNAENMWSCVKRKIRQQYGTSWDLFPTYMYEIVFHSCLQNKEVFTELVVCIIDSYPV